MTNITYHGKVNIKLANTVGKVVWQANYTNNGTKVLFDFLKLCLIGDYKTAENSRPLKIAFGHNSDATPITANYENFEPCTPGIVINTAATITRDDVTLHFVVPYTAFAPRDIEVNQVSLYPANANHTMAQQIAAYFYLTNQDKTEWEPLDLSAMNENYSYIVEWKLNFSNPTATN